MASERCAGCFGTGKGVNGGSCTFCAGTGSIWVPDKGNYSRPVSRGRNRGQSASSGPSWLDKAFEDNLAEIAALVVWGIIVYKGLTESDVQWYIPVIVGFVAGFIAYKLLSGPLRPLGTLIKYLFYIGLLAMAIYGIYKAVILFL